MWAGKYKIQNMRIFPGILRHQAGRALVGGSKADCVLAASMTPNAKCSAEKPRQTHARLESREQVSRARETTTITEHGTRNTEQRKLNRFCIYFPIRHQLFVAPLALDDV